jgi:hypothetical protein
VRLLVSVGEALRLGERIGLGMQSHRFSRRSLGLVVSPLNPNAAANTETDAKIEVRDTLQVSIASSIWLVALHMALALPNNNRIHSGRAD